MPRPSRHPGPPEGSLRAASSSWLLAAQHGQRIFAQRGQGSRRARRESPAEWPQRMRPAPETPAPGHRASRSRARSGSTSVVTASATTMPSITSLTRSSAKRPARAGLLHQHDDGDGDPGQPRTAAQTQQAADDHRRQHGQDVVPRQRAKQRKRKAEERADQCAQDAIARGGDGGAEVRLQHDDGADGAPVAVVQAERMRQPPAQCGGQRGLCGMDQQPLALPGKQSGLSVSSTRSLIASCCWDHVLFAFRRMDRLRSSMTLMATECSMHCRILRRSGLADFTVLAPQAANRAHR